MTDETQTEQETDGEKIEQEFNKEVENSGLNNENTNSFIPMLNECERFLKFLNTKFSLNLTDNYVVTINKAGKNTIGYFEPVLRERLNIQF